MEDRTELTGAGFGDARDQVAKTAQIKENDTRDFDLTAIGQHPLLSKADEIRLGLAVERRMELKQRRQAFEEEHGYPPSTAELVADIYRALIDCRFTIREYLTSDSIHCLQRMRFALASLLSAGWN